MNRESVAEIPLWEKMNLTLDEAALYTGIGKHRLRAISDREDCEFVLWVGNRRMFKRKKLEEYLESRFNDFASRYPDLVKEWSSRNQITPGSIPENKPMLFWWKCRKCGMEYQAWPKSRIEGSGCPYCSEKVLVEGVNDLASRYPEIASEWDYQKNGDTKPTQVKSRSKAYYWWKGTCGHTWKARVYDRTVRHQGCTKCEEAFLAALPQLLVLLYAHRFQLKVLLQSDKIIGIPIEITIPGLGIAAETVEPGMQQKKIQMVKERLCSARGIRFVLMPLPTSVADAYNNVMKLLAYGHVYPQSSAKDDIDYVRKLFSPYGGHKQNSKEYG